MTHWDTPPGRHSSWDDMDDSGNARTEAGADRPHDGLDYPRADTFTERPGHPASPLPWLEPPPRPVSSGRPPVSGPRSGGAPPLPPPPPPTLRRDSPPPQRPMSGPPPVYPSRPVSGAAGSGRGRPVSPAPVAGRRSHWVDERGVDHRGRRVVDVDRIDPREDDPDRGLGRRKAMVAIGGVTAAAAVAFLPQGLDLGSKLFGGRPDERLDAAPTSRDTLPGNGSVRPAGQQASTNLTYPDQNDSYMGSSAGDQVRRNTPQHGQVMTHPAAAVAAPHPIALSAVGPDPIRHLLSRVTFGATPALVASVTKMGVDQWIAWQLAPEKIAPTRAEAKLSELTTLNKTVDQLQAARDANDKAGIHPEQEWVEATIARQIWSDRQLLEVMVDFWNDFLHVAANFDGNEMVRASFDQDVIRKYALDNYPDMFAAAQRHPAMLRYLDQDQSRKDAINENLGRENLELFSVGVDGGYTEKDVRQAAILQTGRSISNDHYIYRADQHAVGPVTIMGFSHPNDTAAGGEAASEAYFRYLAMHPSTAHFIAQNLATRLVSDTPPATLVDAVAASYLKNKGQIKPMLVTLLSSTQFWGAVGQKVRRPMEFLAATYRTLGVQPDAPASFKNTDPHASPFLQGLRQIRNKLEQLGQSPAGQPTPNGYPDVFVAWTSAGTMVSLWNEALDLINGAHPMFTYTKPEQLIGTTAPALAGQYVTELARRLVHVTLPAKDQALLLDVAGLTATTKVNASLNGAVSAVARAILASPQHLLR